MLITFPSGARTNGSADGQLSVGVPERLKPRLAIHSDRTPPFS